MAEGVPEGLPRFKDSVLWGLECAEFPEDTLSSGYVDPRGDPASAEFSHRTRAGPRAIDPPAIATSAR